MSNFTATITIDGIAVYVEGTFTKGDPGRWTMADGSPGYPPDGDRVQFKWEIQGKVNTWHDYGTLYDLLILDYGSEQKIYEAIENMILDNPDKYVG